MFEAVYLTLSSDQVLYVKGKWIPQIENEKKYIVQSILYLTKPPYTHGKKMLCEYIQIP